MKSANSAESKLTKARVQLLFDQPFFATLCLRLGLVSAHVPTMATNGKVIYYNPAFVDSLTPQELQGVLAHEVLHCALAHHCRRGTRDAHLWNKAADYAINPIVLKNGLALPSGALLNPDYEGLSAEEIYAQLMQQSAGGNGSGQPQFQPIPAASPVTQSHPSPSQPGPSGENNNNESQSLQSPSESPNSQPSDPLEASGDGAVAGPAEALPGGFGEVLDATDDLGNTASEAEASRQAAEWSIAAEQAMRATKACGHEAAGIERPLQESRESKQDWRSTLHDFIAATIPSDYRWNPPNRRFVASGLYLPSVYREGVGTIVIGVDTSGSIGDEELKQFAGEISAISEQAQPEAIHVIYCDEVVNATQEFGPSEPVTLEPKGGGGTNFRPVFEWVETNNVLPACLIYLTDLECNDYPESAPGYPVLWVTDSRRTAPFGETLKILAD
jgi:predicted metal-dependent peptidase